MMGFHPDVRDLVEKEGIPTETLYTLDDVTFWRADIPEDSPLFKRPEFVMRNVQQQLMGREVVAKRFGKKVKLWGVLSGKKLAVTRDKSGNIVIPVSRSKSVMQEVFKNPDTGVFPPVKAIPRSVLREELADASKSHEVKGIMYIVCEGFKEDYGVHEVLQVIGT